MMQNLIQYWQEGLKWQARQHIVDTGSRYSLPISSDDVILGKLPPDTTQELFSDKTHPVLQNKRRAVLVAPVSLKSKAGHRLSWYGAPPVLCPVWIPALLSDDGVLELQHGTEPWVHRSILDPSPTLTMTLGTLENLDDFLFVHSPFKSNASWPEVIDYCERMFREVFKADLFSFENENYNFTGEGLVLPELSVAAFQTQYQLLSGLCEREEIGAAAPFLRDVETSQSAQPALHLASTAHKRPSDSEESQLLKRLLSFVRPQGASLLSINAPLQSDALNLCLEALMSEAVQRLLDKQPPPSYALVTPDKQSALSLRRLIVETCTQNMEAFPLSSIATHTEGSFDEIPLLLTSITEDMAEGLSCEKAWLESLALIEENYPAGVSQFLNAKKAELNFVLTRLSKHEIALSDWEKHCEGMPTWMKMMGFLWFVRTQKTLRDAVYLRQHEVDWSEIESSEDASLVLFEKTKQLRHESSLLESEIKTAEEFLTGHAQARQRFAKWAVRNKYDGSVSMDEFLNENHRLKVLSLVLHSWKQGPQNWHPHLLALKEKHTTLYGDFLPFFIFSAREWYEKLSEPPTHPIFDCMIVVQAEQIGAESALPLLSLAKCAVVCGDERLVERSPLLTPSMDECAIEKHHLACEITEQGFRTFLDSGLGLSEGSILKACQKLSEPACLHEKLSLRQGSNDMILGAMAHLTNSSVHTYAPCMPPAPLPILGYYPVTGESFFTAGGSTNEAEAVALVSWLIQYRGWIEQSHNTPLKDCITIVTLNTRQKNIFLRLLSEAKLPRIPVSTLRTFKGLERKVVLLSLVHDKSCNKPHPLERDPRLLTNLLSRTQQSLLIFGHTRILEESQPKSPVRKLADILFSSISHHLEQNFPINIGPLTEPLIPVSGLSNPLSHSFEAS